MIVPPPIIWPSLIPANTVKSHKPTHDITIKHYLERNGTKNLQISPNSKRVLSLSNRNNQPGAKVTLQPTKCFGVLVYGAPVQGFHLLRYRISRTLSRPPFSFNCISHQTAYGANGTFWGQKPCCLEKISPLQVNAARGDGGVGSESNLLELYSNRDTE